MKSIVSKIKNNANDVIKDNNFLIVAYQNRLLSRMIRIFEKYNIPFNKNILNKSIEEYMINNMFETNEEIIDKYISLLENYEKIIQNYVEKKVKTSEIKAATVKFIDKISKKNQQNYPQVISNNFIENIKSMIFVYDNRNLNEEIISRINVDTDEIRTEINRNNYNFVIESINIIIKNILSNM